MVVAGDNLDLTVRRMRLGLTQEAVARALGVAQSAISRFETDDVPLSKRGNLTRADYERFLDSAEKRAKKGAVA